MLPPEIFLRFKAKQDGRFLPRCTSGNWALLNYLLLLLSHSLCRIACSIMPAVFMLICVICAFLYQPLNKFTKEFYEAKKAQEAEQARGKEKKTKSVADRGDSTGKSPWRS